MSVIEINRRPSRKDLLWFGVILPVFFGMVGTMVRSKLGAGAVGAGLWGFGALLTFAYWVLPPLRIAVYLAWMHLFFPLGWLVSHAVLAVLFFGIATPTALVMRLLKRDPLHRGRDPAAGTYWVEHRTGEKPARYLRQY